MCIAFYNMWVSFTIFTRERCSNSGLMSLTGHYLPLMETHNILKLGKHRFLDTILETWQLCMTLVYLMHVAIPNAIFFSDWRNVTNLGSCEILYVIKCANPVNKGFPFLDVILMTFGEYFSPILPATMSALISRIHQPFPNKLRVRDICSRFHP